MGHPFKGRVFTAGFTSLLVFFCAAPSHAFSCFTLFGRTKTVENTSEANGIDFWKNRFAPNSKIVELKKAHQVVEGLNYEETGAISSLPKLVAENSGAEKGADMLAAAFKDLRVKIGQNGQWQHVEGIEHPENLIGQVIAQAYDSQAQSGAASVVAGKVVDAVELRGPSGQRMWVAEIVDAEGRHGFVPMGSAADRNYGFFVLKTKGEISVGPLVASKIGDPKAPSDLTKQFLLLERGNARDTAIQNEIKSLEKASEGDIGDLLAMVSSPQKQAEIFGTLVQQSHLSMALTERFGQLSPSKILSRMERGPERDKAITRFLSGTFSHVPQSEAENLAGMAWSPRVGEKVAALVSMQSKDKIDIASVVARIPRGIDRDEAIASRIRMQQSFSDPQAAQMIRLADSAPLKLKVFDSLISNGIQIADFGEMFRDLPGGPALDKLLLKSVAKINKLNSNEMKQMLASASSEEVKLKLYQALKQKVK